jgi:hypothetical protein
MIAYQFSVCRGLFRKSLPPRVTQAESIVALNTPWLAYLIYGASSQDQQKSSFFRDITLCNPVKLSSRSDGTYCLHFQDKSKLSNKPA